MNTDQLSGSDIHWALSGQHPLNGPWSWDVDPTVTVKEAVSLPCPDAP